MMRALHLVLLVVGAALLVALVRSVGFERLLGELRELGLAFAGVIALELVLDACNTLGWRSTIRSRAVGYWRLFWVRQAGTAVNQLTPTATLGGEVVKAMLLRPRVPAADAVASIVTAKLSFAIAQMLLVLLGLTTALGRVATPALRSALLTGSAAACVGVGGFLLLQRRGALAPAIDVVVRLGVRGAWVRRLGSHAATLDARIAALHRERPGAFVASVGWHFAAQLVGAAQLFYMLHALAVRADAMTCIAIEAFALVIDSALFFVPGRIGVQEGSRVLVFTSLGLSAATGLAVAIIVRLTQLAVAATGLVAYGYFSITTPAVNESIAEI